MALQDVTLKTDERPGSTPTLGTMRLPTPFLACGCHASNYDKVSTDGKLEGAEIKFMRPGDPFTRCASAAALKECL
jgi:hypothetical protein